MKLVRVTWDDAEDPTGDIWVEDADLDRFIAERSCSVVSVGFLARESDRYILLVADHGEDYYGRVTKIPRGMITSIDELS